MRKYNILITGCAGFIGSSLVSKLVNEGHNVVGLDNINSYYDKNLKYARLIKNSILKTQDEAIKIKNNILIDSYKYKNYKFIKLDIEDKDKLFELFRNNNFDLVCNLAGQAGVRYSLENPDAYISSNITGFLNILEACREFSIKKLLFASSSSIYGANKKTPFSVNDKTDSPISLYAATKKSNELMAHTYSHLFGINCIGLRFFTVYGPYGRPDMAMYLFVKAAFENKTIKVFNKGEMLRDFTYIDDVIELVNKAIYKLEKEEENNFYKIYNVGNSKPIKLSKFIEVIENKLGFKIKKENLSLQAGDVLDTHCDMSETIKDLKYTPKTSIEMGVNNFINWYIEFFKIKKVNK